MGDFVLKMLLNMVLKRKGFSDDIIQFICDKLIESNLDYIEIGAVELSNKDKTIYGIKKNICDFSQFINASKNQKKNIAVFFLEDLIYLWIRFRIVKMIIVEL